MTSLSLSLPTHVVVINITVGIAETRTVLFLLSFPVRRNDTRLTTLDPCQFHKLLFVSEGSVMQNRKASTRWIYVFASV